MTINLTPTQDTVLLHFFQCQSDVQRVSEQAAINYVVQSTNKLPSDVQKAYAVLENHYLIDFIPATDDDPLSYYALTENGLEYLKEAGWTLDAARDNFREHVGKPKAKKVRKPRERRAPAGLPNDADPETLRMNREDMKSSAPRTSGSHANCDHEATKPARSKCRKARLAAS